MTTQIISVEEAKTLGAFYFTVSLDGKTYQFNFQFNDREGNWYFDLVDTDGNHIRDGVKVVVNWPFLEIATSILKPAGELLCLDTRQVTEDPGLENLGIDSFLVYEGLTE